MAPVGPDPMTTTSGSATVPLGALSDEGDDLGDDLGPRPGAVQQVDVAAKVLGRADPSEDRRHRRERTDEGDRQLVEGRAAADGQRTQGVDHGCLRVVGDGRRVTGGAAEESAAEHAARPHLDRSLGEAREEEVAGLRVEDPERHLNGRHRWHAQPVDGRLDLLGADPEGEHLARLAEVGELVEQPGVDLGRAVQLVEVDAVGPQPP